MPSGSPPSKKQRLWRAVLFLLGGLALSLVGCDGGERSRSQSYPAAAAKQGYWPRWSGPNSDFISRETGWSSKWPKQGLRVDWETNVGIGFSSVSVVDGRLLTMGHRDGRDYVYCLDAKSGKQHWSYDYKCELVDNLHEGGPGSTPTINKDRVFTLSREGHLFCFDVRTGDVHWTKRLQTELGVKMPDWGFTCSPLVLDKKLILEAGRTSAFDTRTGEKLWQTKLYRPGYGSPRAFQRHKEMLVAVLNNDKLLVVNANDGTEVASFPWTTHFKTSSTTPIVHDDTIFLSTGYNQGCALLRWQGDELELVYENREMRNHMNNSVLWNGYLYGIDGNSHNPRTCRLVCMNYETGKVAWKKRGFGCGSLMLANGKLVILSDRGTLVLAEASPREYRELGRTELFDERCWTVPVVVAGRVYCRNAAGDLVCVNLPAAKD